MWMIVLFDLPVVTKPERRAATNFRNLLLDEGFHMSQYSVYYRLLSGKEALEGYVNKIRKSLPEKGKVDIISITDKQYENIHSFSGNELRTKRKTQQQFLLF